MKFLQGFTLIELMVVVTIVSILALIFVPSYQRHTRETVSNLALQEMHKTSTELEKHKARNFSYKGFNVIPEQVKKGNVEYSIQVVDLDTGQPLTKSNAIGRRWAIKATNTDSNYSSFLLTSTGISCKNRASANISFVNCGTGGESL